MTRPRLALFLAGLVTGAAAALIGAVGAVWALIHDLGGH